MKAKECKLVVNTRSGAIMTPIDFPSIKKAVDYAKSGECIGFAYNIFVDGLCVRSGLVDNPY